MCRPSATIRGRRQLLAGLGLLALMSAARVRAQAPARPKRVVTVLLGPVKADRSARRAARRLMWSRQGLVEGRDFYETLVAPDDLSDGALERLAREVVASRPDLILTNGYSQTRAFMVLTRDIPIVFCCVSDPESLVPTLRRPGGNVTGSSSGVRELRLKLLEVIREALPKARRVAFFNDLEPGEGPGSWLRVAMAEQAARLGMELVHIASTHRRAPEDLAAALCEAKVDAFLLHSAARLDWAELQRRCRVPGFSGMERGLLAGLGPPPDEDPHERAIVLAARVVRGESPGVIPVTQPLRVHLSINLRTARELGIELPATLLARADETVR